MDVAVGIDARIGTLTTPVVGTAHAVGERSIRIAGRRDAALGDLAARKRLALVEARRADQAEGGSLGKMAGQLAVVAQGRQPRRLVDAVDALVGNERSRPLLVVLGIV